MRISETPNEKQGTLLIDGPLGVEWILEDAWFQSIAMGAVPASLQLPAGLYTVTWTAAGRSENRLIRVKADDIVQAWGGDFPLGSAPPSNLSGASQLERNQFAAATKALEKPALASEAEILVLIRSPNDRPSSDLGRTIRLYDGAGEAMRSRIRRKNSKVKSDDQFAVRNYAVPTGNYILRYEASDRRVLEQSVYAFAGRRTVVFLQYGTSVIAQGAGSTSLFKRRRGIDPAQTTIVSTRLTSSTNIEFSSRIADIVLHKLATREPVIESLITSWINDFEDDDPYLRIYAAALLLNISPGEEKWDARLAQSATNALKFLDGQQTDCPDIFCLHSAAEAALQGASGNWAGRVAAPPMLDISWRWAAALSVSVPLLADNPLFAAVSRVTQPTPPWITWPARALEYRQQVQPPPAPDAVEGLVSALAEKATSLQERDRSDPDRLTKRRRRLSSSTAEFANAAISVTGGRTGRSIAEQLAFSTGTTLDLLPEQLEQALSEINEQIEDQR